MPRATSSTRPRVFSSTPTESASWRDRPVARAETPPATSFDAAATTSTTRISPPLREVEVAEVRRRARKRRGTAGAGAGRATVAIADRPLARAARATGARRGRRRRTRRRRSAGPPRSSRATRRRGRRRRRGSRATTAAAPRRAGAAGGRRGRRARPARARARLPPPRASRPRAPLDELFAASASASAIQLRTSFTAAQLTCERPDGRADEAVLLEDPREHRERGDRDRGADEEHERQPVDGRAVDGVVAAEEPERDAEPGEERHAEDGRGHRREVVRPRQVRAVELRAEREREGDEADRAEVADDAHRVLGEQVAGARSRAPSARSARPRAAGR